MRQPAPPGALRGSPAPADEVAVRFSKANKKKVHELLETLVAVGQARVTPDDRYAL